MNINRKGVVRINKRFISGEWECDLSLIFKEIVPIKISEDYNEVFEYTSLSKHFDELKEGDKIPYYDAIICHERDESATIRFDKVI